MSSRLDLSVAGVWQSGENPTTQKRFW